MFIWCWNSYTQKGGLLPCHAAVGCVLEDGRVQVEVESLRDQSLLTSGEGSSTEAQSKNKNSPQWAGAWSPSLAGIPTHIYIGSASGKKSLLWQPQGLWGQPQWPRLAVLR